MNPAQLGYAIVQFLELLKYLIIFRCVLTFFPALNWDQQPWLAVRSATDPLLQPFRNLLPPMGGMDLSPILLFFALGILQGLVAGLF